MPRKVRIATVCQNYDVTDSVDENRRRLLERAEVLVGSEPDLICLPETFTWPFDATDLAKGAETVPGPTIDACADLARRANANLICPLFSREGDRFLNSAVVIDRKGTVVGSYHKAHPVTSSHDYCTLEKGVHPGPVDVPVFDLDFGRIGIQICFDLMYPDTWQRLADKGAEMIFWPSAYDGGRDLVHKAYELRVPVVSSSRGPRSRIINRIGEVLARTSEYQATAVATLDLETLICHTDFHSGIADRLQAAYGDRVNCRSFHEEGFLMIESNDPNLPLASIVAEQGLESINDYLARNQKTYDALRADKEPTPQEPPYLDRSQYG